MTTTVNVAVLVTATTTGPDTIHHHCRREFTFETLPALANSAFISETIDANYPAGFEVRLLLQTHTRTTTYPCCINAQKVQPLTAPDMTHDHSRQRIKLRIIATTTTTATTRVSCLIRTHIAQINNITRHERTQSGTAT